MHSTFVQGIQMKFVRMAANRGGNFHANSGGVSAYLDMSGTYHLNGHTHRETVRSRNCHLLTNNIKFPECTNYRDTLGALVQATTSVTISVHQHT